MVGISERETLHKQYASYRRGQFDGVCHNISSDWLPKIAHFTAVTIKTEPCCTNSNSIFLSTTSLLNNALSLTANPMVMAGQLSSFTGSCASTTLPSAGSTFFT